MIGIEGGNAERQEFSRRGKFRAQISVLPVTNLFHGFAKCGTGTELGQVRTPKFRKKFPKNWGMGLGPLILELKQGRRSPIVRWQKCRAKPLGGADIKGQILNFGPDFLETGELWSTYFGTFRKPSISTTSHPKYVGQSSKPKSYKRSNFENNSNFIEISELKCLISRKRLGVLT